MLIYLQSILCHTLLLFLLVTSGNIYVIRATSSSSLFNNYNNKYFARQAEEYIMTSAAIDGIRRSNVCGDGYRIEGALLKSYPYSIHETYLPYEDCLMSFQARRANNQIRIRIILLDLNDIQGGVNCLDSLRFYKSVYAKRMEKLNSVECGKLTEADYFTFVSTTGIVTAHFRTDGGNVSGIGFQVILTAFRYPNKTHPCDPDDDEFRCNNGECISSFLLCDGVAHCLDGSDESPNRVCLSHKVESSDHVNIEGEKHQKPTKHQSWRGVMIIAFFLIIFLVFTLFMIYFLCRRCLHSSEPSIYNEQESYSSIVKTSFKKAKTPAATTTRVIVQNNKHSKDLDADYNFL